MVITVEDSIEVIPGNGRAEYTFVFTEVSTQRQETAYTAVIGEKACVGSNSKVVKAVKGDLAVGGLYIINITPYSLSSRVYGGIARFERTEAIYFAVVFPDWAILDRLEPVPRWRFRYISFEYPRKGKRGFLLPTISRSPFAYCFITQAEKEIIEYLCPPLPVARYMPEEYGYQKEELLIYLNDEEERRRHAGELYPIIDSIFRRSNGDREQYIPMDKDLIPEEYRDYQMLYNADSLWDW